LPVPTDLQESDAVYFAVLRLFLVRYSPVWAIAMAVAGTGVLGGVLAYGLRERILSWPGLGYGAFALFVGVAIAHLPGLVLGRLPYALVSRLVDRSLVQPLHVGMVASALLAITVLWYRLSRRIRDVGLPDLAMGALLPMAIAMVGTSVAFPAASFAFTWPLLASLPAYTIWFHGYARQINSGVTIVGLLMAGLVTIVVVGPSVLLALFDPGPMRVSLIFLALMCGFLVPHIHLMTGASPGHQ
jgi:hypothetical protein